MQRARFWVWALALAALGWPAPSWAQEPSSAFEPALAGGFADGVVDNAVSLRVDEVLGLDVSAFGPGVTALVVRDEGGVLGLVDPTAPGASSLALTVPAELAYGVVEVVLTGPRPPAQVAGIDVLWVGDGPMFTTIVLELYRGERAAIEAWLPSVRATAEARPDFCPEGELPRPVHAMRVDLDQNGVAEGLATVASSLAPDWFCRWGEVHATGPTAGQAEAAAHVSLGLVQHGWPYLSIIEVTLPNRRGERLISSHFECCDLDQTFEVLALRDGTLVRLFDNAATPDGRSGYGMWGQAPDGRPAILFTPDVETYNDGEPADRASLSRYELYESGFALAAESGVPLHPAAGLGEVCNRGRREGLPLDSSGPWSRPCAEGLTCCYPCGIQGCDWVCMDVESAGRCPAFP